MGAGRHRDHIPCRRILYSRTSRDNAGSSTSTVQCAGNGGGAGLKVTVFENGVEAGEATYIPYNTQTFKSVTAGETYDINAESSQDWWAIGYHVGVIGRGVSNTSYYTYMFHMWKYEAKDAAASIKVRAEDPYGNVYECSDVITEGTAYPDYIKTSMK